MYQSEVVPGLLQTPDYARRLREIHSLLPAAEIPASVLSLMNRQTVLFDESKQFDLVMTETALRWRPGPASVMLAQLDRIAALVQIVVHMRFFLHVDLSRQKREDLQLILFTVLLLALMGGGTIWILTDLAARMH